MGIQSIFNRIECNSSAMSEMLADSQVTEANMMQYLGMIEQRTNEILQLYAAIKIQTDKASSAGAKPGVDSRALMQKAGLVDPASLKASKDGAPGGASQAMLNILGLGPPTPMGQDLIQVDPPNLEDYSSEDESEEDDEEDARPLTREELKAKTLKGIHRKANHAHGQRSLGGGEFGKHGTRGGGRRGGKGDKGMR